VSTTVSVCVVGSFMTDLVMRVARRPQTGETVRAEEFGIFLGGKGFNQAVAARRLGARVAIIGRVGADEFGSRFLDALAREGIEAAGVIRDPDEGTGIATPVVDATGANSIIIAPRANLRLTPADVEACAAAIVGADVLILQLEVPPEASMAAARIARAAGRRVVLNPAPVMPFPDELLHLADVVTPNEVEAAALAGMAVTGPDSGFMAAAALLARGARAAVVTLGAAGCVVATAHVRAHLPAFAVEAVDTTAAGDAFTAALAVRLAEAGDLLEAARWGNAAGACAVGRLGAEPSLPPRTAVVAMLARGALTA
jgi:ribokinase